MRLKKLWVVTDPRPISTLADILFETTSRELVRYAVGTGVPAWEHENTTFHTTARSAKADAVARMEAAGLL